MDYQREKLGDAPSFPPSLVDNCGLLLIEEPESSISPTSTKGIQWREKEMSV